MIAAPDVRGSDGWQEIRRRLCSLRSRSRESQKQEKELPPGLLRLSSLPFDLSRCAHGSYKPQEHDRRSLRDAHPILAGDQETTLLFEISIAREPETRKRIASWP